MTKSLFYRFTAAGLGAAMMLSAPLGAALAGHHEKGEEGGDKAEMETTKEMDKASPKLYESTSGDDGGDGMDDEAPAEDGKMDKKKGDMMDEGSVEHTDDWATSED